MVGVFGLLGSGRTNLVEALVGARPARGTLRIDGTKVAQRSPATARRGGVVLVAAGLLGALPMAAPRTDVVLLDREVSWLVPVLGLSLVAAVVAYVTGIVGARLLGAKVASFVGLTEVLFAVLFAWLLLGQVLTVWQLVGGALVLAGLAVAALSVRGGPIRERYGAWSRLVGEPRTAA